MASRRRAGFALVTALALATSWFGAAAPQAQAVVLLNLSPSPLDLGNVDLGASASADVTVTNPGASAVAISAIDVPVGGAEFAITGGTCSAPSSIGSGASCTVTITYTPLTATGSQSAGQLHIVANGTDLYNALQGTGMPVISGGGPINFGDQPKGSSSAPLPATITNMGSHTVTPVSAAISGTNAADFVKGTDTCSGQPIATLSGCSVQVTFHPTALGARSATLTITFPAPIPAVTFDLTGNGLTPNSSVVWKTTYAAGGNYTWNYGNALGRTVKSGVQQLHLLYQTDVVGGKAVTDSGPYMGVNYTHSTTGSTWSSAKRLNPSNQHGSRVGLAASGAYVYAIWVSLTKWVSPAPTKPRVLYLRVNSNHGASTAWKTVKRITSLTGRVDYPTVAASGAYVYIAYTDGNTGSVKLAISANYGSTFKIVTVGSTTALNPSGYGYEGDPVVAASGANVIVAWDANTNDAVVARVSANRGTSWGTRSTLVSSSYGQFSAAYRGSRAAVAWVDTDGVKVRVRTTSWSATRMAAPYNGDEQYAPTVALQDTNRVAVTWGAWQGGANEPLMWVESPNNGASFYQPQAVADTSVVSHPSNEGASILWPSASTRLVSWNGWDAGDTSYRQYFRTGTGTPTGLSLPAPLASVTPAIAAPRTLHREDRRSVR